MTGLEIAALIASVTVPWSVVAVASAWHRTRSQQYELLCRDAVAAREWQRCEAEAQRKFTREEREREKTALKRVN